MIFISYVRDTSLLRRVLPGQRNWRTLAPRTVLASIAIATGLFAVPFMRAQSAKPTDWQVKAAYLYNFGRFVQWPAKVTAIETGPFSICVLGQDPFGVALDATLAGEKIGNQKVVARRISSPHESVDCQVLFISATEASRLNKIMDSLDKSPVLTVSDIPQFSQHRGMIQFVLEGSRIRFEVNLTATQSAGLTLSSELLKVATAVRKDRE